MEERIPTPPHAPATLAVVAVSAFFASLVAFGAGRMLNWTWRFGAPEAWKRVRAIVSTVERRLAHYTFTRRIFFVLGKATPHDMGFWLYKNYAEERSETVPPPPEAATSDRPLPAAPDDRPDELDRELDVVLKQLAAMARTRAILEATEEKRLLKAVDEIRKIDGKALNRILEAVDRLQVSKDARKKLARSILSRKNLKKATGLADEDLLFVFRDMDLKRMQELMKEKGARALELHVKETRLREDMARRRREEASTSAEEERRDRRPPEYFTALFEAWRRHSTCMDRLARLDGLVRRHEDRLPPQGSDLSAFQEALKEQGFVEQRESCPDGGRYDLDGRRAVCTVHGNQERPQERLAEFREHLFPFIRLRDRWNEVRDALGPEGVEARRALLVELDTLLKTASTHPYGHELAGRILVHEKNWKDALPHLEKARDAFPRNRLVAYGLALCLAATEGRDDELRPLLEKAEAAPFDAAPENFRDRFEWYDVGDRCARFLEELKKKTPFEKLGQILEGPTPSALCRRRLLETRELLRGWAKSFPANSRQLARIDDRLRTLRQEFDGIDPNDVDRRPRRQKLAALAARLESKRRACLDDRSPPFFSKEFALWIKDRKLPSCPRGGRHGLTDGGSLDCSAHPGIVQSSWVGPLFKKLGGETLDRGNRGLLLGQLQTLPERRRCFLVQRKLEEAASRWTGKKKPGVDDLVRGARLKPEQARCPEGGHWLLREDGKALRPTCSKHGHPDDWLGFDETFLKRRGKDDEEGGR